MSFNDLSDVWNLTRKKMSIESDIRKLENRRRKIVNISGKVYDMDGYSRSIGNLIGQCENSLESGIKGIGAVSTVNGKIDDLKEKLPLSSQTEISDASSHMSKEINRIDNLISSYRDKVSAYENKIEKAKSKILE